MLAGLVPSRCSEGETKLGLPSPSGHLCHSFACSHIPTVSVSIFTSPSSLCLCTYGPCSVTTYWTKDLLTPPINLHLMAHKGHNLTLSTQCSTLFCIMITLGEIKDKYYMTCIDYESKLLWNAIPCWVFTVSGCSSIALSLLNYIIILPCYNYSLLL